MKAIAKFIKEHNIQKYMLGQSIYWSFMAAILEFVARLMTGEENPLSPTFLYVSVMCYFIHVQMKES